jgi:RNA polymerase sigma-70 factor, ECF subfamily
VDEKQAIAQLKKGDLDGLETLVNLYQLQAIRTVCLIIGDSSQSEDIVQTAFIRAAERIYQFDDRRDFKPWFMSSVIHDALKFLNRQNRFVSLEANEETETSILFDPSPLPEELLETRETSEAVWRALQELNPKKRAAMVMRYYLDMHEDEIARELNGASGSVKWWLFAARQQLKKRLLSTRASPEISAQPVQTNISETGDQR